MNFNANENKPSDGLTRRYLVSVTFEYEIEAKNKKQAMRRAEKKKIHGTIGNNADWKNTTAEKMCRRESSFYISPLKAHKEQ